MTAPSAGPFSKGFMADERQATVDAANAPEVGMAFQEMYSHWTFVTDVTEHTVQIVSGGGHPSWFPECGRAEVVARDEFPDRVKYAFVVSDRRYPVEGWGARAEGLSKRELERRIRDGRRSGRVPDPGRQQ